MWLMSLQVVSIKWWASLLVSRGFWQNELLSQCFCILCNWYAAEAHYPSICYVQTSATAEIRRGKAGSLHIIHSAFSTQSSETSGLLSRMKALITVKINGYNQSLSTAPSVTVEPFTSCWLRAGHDMLLINPSCSHTRTVILSLPWPSLCIHSC